ncbi:MAG: Glutamine synthetase family protein in hypothetical Actinobacterial gene cluster, partial [uncultured Nocardioides sp.]
DRPQRALPHPRPAPCAHRVRRGRHRRDGLHRHAGPPPGQAPARALLPRRRAGGRHRGLQLPAGRRRRHEHRRGLRDLVMAARLRRHGVRPRLGHPPPAPPPPGDGDGAVRPRVARPRTGRPVATHGAPHAARPGGRAGLDRPGRHRAGVHRLQHLVRGRAPRALPRARAGQPVQHRLLHPRHDAGGAAAARDPQPHVRRGHGRRERQGRVQLRAARDRLPLRRVDGHRRQPQRLQERRQGDRGAAGEVPDLHGQVQPAGGQLLPHPPLAARDRRRGRLLGRRLRRANSALRPVRRRPAGDHGRLHAALRAEHQLLQALRRRVVRPDHHRVGARQPDLRRAPGGPRRRGADGEPRAGRRRQPLPGAGRDARGRPARHRAGARARARAGRQRLRQRRPRADPDDPARGARGLRRLRRRAGRPRRRRGRPLHQHGRRRAGGVRRGRDRLGAVPRLREAV